jgi:hypothetical protein
MTYQKTMIMHENRRLGVLAYIKMSDSGIWEVKVHAWFSCMDLKSVETNSSGMRIVKEWSVIIQSVLK